MPSKYLHLTLYLAGLSAMTFDMGNRRKSVKIGKRSTIRIVPGLVDMHDD